MSEGELIFNKILNIRYGFNDRYGLTFIRPMDYKKYEEYLFQLRKLKFMCAEDIQVLIRIGKHHNRNFFKIKHLESKEPRLIAQRFISKTNIRQFIFSRDNYKCLKCGRSERLSVDHIVPVAKGGKNELMNLQTLCTSCNSTKRDNYADYRNNK